MWVDTLAGMWTHIEAVCEGELRPATVQELTLNRGRWTSWTFTPFENYVDYAGEYSWDRPGTLTIRVAGGGGVRGDDELRLQASVEGHRLILEGAFLGDRETGPRSADCRYVFERRGR